MASRNVKTWIDTILNEVKTKLTTTDSVFASNYVFLSTEEDQGEPPSIDQYAQIVAGPQRPDQGAVAGGGNTALFFNGECAVIVWNRLYLDQKSRDDQYLTHATLGVWAKMRLTLKSLQMFDPVNGSGDYYLLEPFRISDSGWLTRRRRTQAGWGSVAASWSFQYLADITS